ncbi:MAG TPA: MMPL family transporter, partial [Solirubrobacteraceae bacterium]|nr:MMPL family transporter [Solirubrobacteraceae bacterium]
LAGLPHVASVVSPTTPAGAHQIATDGHVEYLQVDFDNQAGNLPTSAINKVVDVARSYQAPGYQVAVGGPAIEQVAGGHPGSSEGVGILAAIVIMLLAFGSVVAMGLPILTALFGIAVAYAVLVLVSHLATTQTFAPDMMAMIGLGVGIDYALFILTRFREAFHTPGPTFHDTHASIAQAIDTAGRAVLFAGTTVVIALLGMMLLGVAFLYGLAISASLGVLMMMLASLTLLPALLSLAGTRVAKLGRRARARAQRSASAEGTRVAAAPAPGAAAATGAPAPAPGGRVWLRWSAFVQGRPWTVAGVAALVMLVIAAPAVALRLGSSDAANDPAGQTTHKAYELLAQGFGQGFNGPLLIVAKVPRAGGEAAALAAPAASVRGSAPSSVETLRSALARTPGVVAVPPARLNGSGAVATLTVYPRFAPQAYATTQLVSRLRDSVIPPIAARTHMTVYVGGVTAGAVDFAALLGRKLPLFIGVVVLLSALLLMVVFRSLVIPLQAAVMNLLSIGASLGVIVAIFQWGWLRSLMGVQKGPVESFIPVLLFAIVFGLSMDYEVFLVSRMHERWRRSHEHSHAVADGLSLTGRVVTAAAAIMVCVFLSFTLLEGRVIKEFGLSLASAVFLDALVVRCLLLPATLHIVGARTWWLPAWLDRLLPRVNVEGTPPSPEGDGSDGHGGPGGHPRARPGIAAEGAEA